MAPATTRLCLLCLACHRFRQINDHLVDAFIHLIDHYEQQATWRHVNLTGRFDFSATTSSIDFDALAARYADPEIWHRLHEMVDIPNGT